MTQTNEGRHRLLPLSVSRHKTLIWISLSPLLLIALLGLFAGCAWQVIPPPEAQDPANVFVNDYGRHSRLALPLDEEWMVEYAFGDWRYYGQGERSLWRGLVALLIPTDAALGRRFLPLIEKEDLFSERTGAVRSTRIEVEREKVNELLLYLNSRFERNRESETSPANSDLSFVNDDPSYHLLHNSNHQVADWLTRLNCKVRGTPILSNFTVRDSSENVAR